MLCMCTYFRSHEFSNLYGHKSDMTIGMLKRRTWDSICAVADDNNNGRVTEAMAPSA